MGKQGCGKDRGPETEAFLRRQNVDCPTCHKVQDLNGFYPITEDRKAVIITCPHCHKTSLIV